ncbi:MAG: hypothetical protein DRI75_02260 [Bacteroidetes bacterium]|nr:MAG: hypothetical protein DRI75_02260 [Bacteroidota bacterium]
MIYRFFFGISLLIAFSNTVIAQESRSKIRVSGIVTDVNGNPLKRVMIFIDKIKTRVKTNKKGIYTIKMNQDSKLLTVYSPNLGILSVEYKGQSKVDFMYTQESIPINEEKLLQLGFTLDPAPKNDNNYSDFSSILEILDKRFYNVRVTNGVIKIGKGANQFGGDSTPLIFVDNQRVNVGELGTIATSDVKSIRVISKGSEAAEYGGLQAANGVILITLKQ